MQPLVLASTSPARSAILKTLGLPFITAAPVIDETPLPEESATMLVTRLAQAKAHALARRYREQWIIAADQVYEINGRIHGKPLTEVKARQQLAMSSGKAVTFTTGLTLLCAARQQIKTVCETFTVYFRVLSEHEIKQYVAREQPLQCAGSFKHEGLGITLFKRMEGRDPNTLTGLPLIALCELLREVGIDPLA